MMKIEKEEGERDRDTQAGMGAGGGAVSCVLEELLCREGKSLNCTGRESRVRQ